MSNICSVCHISSPSKLSPLFIQDGNIWKETGLCEMLERCVGKKISDKSKLEVICIRCIKQIVEIYFKDDRNQPGAELPIILSNNLPTQQLCKYFIYTYIFISIRRYLVLIVFDC